MSGNEEKLREALELVLDAVDYMKGACSPAEPIGGVLTKIIILKARDALRPDTQGETPEYRPTGDPQNFMFMPALDGLVEELEADGKPATPRAPKRWRCTKCRSFLADERRARLHEECGCGPVVEDSGEGARQGGGEG